MFKRGIAPVLTASPKVIFEKGSELQFVDSTGLGTIVSCLKMLNGSGGDLKLCGMSKSIRALFELVRMHRSSTSTTPKRKLPAPFRYHRSHSHASRNIANSL